MLFSPWAISRLCISCVPCFARGRAIVFRAKRDSAGRLIHLLSYLMTMASHWPLLQATIFSSSPNRGALDGMAMVDHNKRCGAHTK